MVVPSNSSEQNQLVYGIKVSSVGPGKVTGQDVVHDPTNMDLAMKLHYLRAVYYFSSQVFEGLTVPRIKEPMFTWLNEYYYACGRFRRSESGRPYIKCNDCGVRFIEAHCAKTLDEWLEMEKEDGGLTKLLLYHQLIGPELQFSPLVYLQITWFKCGGGSVGLSWAHVLGDAVSASDFMKALGHYMASSRPAQPLKFAQLDTKLGKTTNPTSQAEDPLSVKRVGPVGDNWIATTNCKMEVFSLHLSAPQLSHLQSKVCGIAGTNSIPPFESVCALIWKSVAKIRDGPEPKVVTICRNDSHGDASGVSSNGQMVSVVEADCSVTEASPKKLAELMTKGAVDERPKIEEAMERDQGLSDFIVYGANLTFVDLGAADFHGLELRGEKPVHVNCMIDGIGNEGVVLVLPLEPRDGGKGSGGKVVTLIVPESHALELKSELKREFSIA
ncbi:Shikimate O-hydroxycinnamoyltransferase [Bertholletia excelsa]